MTKKYVTPLWLIGLEGNGGGVKKGDYRFLLLCYIFRQVMTLFENQIIYILYDNFKCLSILDKKFWFEALV